MDVEKIENSLKTLRAYIEGEGFKGFDPYDALNTKMNFLKSGKWRPVLFTQFMKRNPVNIRKLIGIKKDFNPKAMGLFLSGYSLLYSRDPRPEYKKKMEFLFDWLINNFTRGYSGMCWGYNFPWSSPKKHLPAYTPSAVVSAFVVRGIYQYFQAGKDKRCPEVIESAAAFVLKDLPKTEYHSGICISYTPVEKDCCFNASLLAGEILAYDYSINHIKEGLKLVKKLLNYVISRQKPDGRWNYSLDLKTGKEREQVDFHQGYILESLFEIINLCGLNDSKYHDSLKRGAEFYWKNQFSKEGRSYWRWPKKWPADIHCQAQGIITFAKLKNLDKTYLDFAFRIADWTIDYMQNKKGYFYYRKHRFYNNRIPYMRWSQAWMFLVLAHILKKI